MHMKNESVCFVEFLVKIAFGFSVVFPVEFYNMLKLHPFNGR